MRHRSDDEIQLRQYLLGEMSDDEQIQLEQRLLTEKDYFQEFLRMEESLTDEYVQGGLNKRERERFESYFMSAPERRESVGFAEALHRHISEKEMLRRGEIGDASHRWFRWRQAGSGFERSWNTAVVASLIGAVLLLATATTLLLIQTSRLRMEASQLRNERADWVRSEEELKRQVGEQQARNEELAKQLNEEQARLQKTEQDLSKLKQARKASRDASGANVVSLLLLPGMGRGIGVSASGNKYHQANITREIKWVRLELEVEEDYKLYKAEVLTAEGEAVTRLDNLRLRLRRDKKIVELKLPARILTKSDYLVALSGLIAGQQYEKTGTYYFTVVRR